MTGTILCLIFLIKNKIIYRVLTKRYGELDALLTNDRYHFPAIFDYIDAELERLDVGEGVFSDNIYTRSLFNPFIWTYKGVFPYPIVPEEILLATQKEKGGSTP